MIDRVDGRRLAATLATLAAIFAVQLSLLGGARAREFGPGFAFDVSALLAVFCFFELFDWALGLRSKIVATLYYLWLLAAWLLVFAHSWFFAVASERRLTPLDMTLDGVRYFFEAALPRNGVLTLVGASLAILSAALIGNHALRFLSRAIAVGISALFVAGIGLGLVRVRKIPSPLYDAAFEAWELVSRPKLRAPASSDPRALAMFDKSDRTHGTEPTRYKKVIVLVMETMTTESFDKERGQLPAGAFLRQARQEQFTNYYPNNQDSRTGMLDMLFSRLIPYEAYSEEGVARYRHLAETPSLVDRMKSLSYATAFAVAQTELEDVVGELGWDRTLHLSEQEIVRARAAGMLCFAPDEYERSCEDVTMLPAVLDFVVHNERAFVYQEFIWGHAAEYNRASGKSNAAYYSAYVDALQKSLAQHGLLEETLIVLTSDHGFRDKSMQDRPSVYHIPLWFSAPDLSPRTDSRLLSHADFGMLLFEHLTPAAARADDNEVVMIVGPTGQGHLFAVGRDGSYALLRHKAGLDLLISQHGQLPIEPPGLLSLFRGYQARFDIMAQRVGQRGSSAQVIEPH